MAIPLGVVLKPEVLEKKVEFKRCREISGPGEYRFATIGDWDGGGDSYGIPSNAIYSREHPNFRWNAIPTYLKERFPRISAKIFIGGCLDCGKSIAEIVDAQDCFPDCLGAGDVFLTLGDENYKVNSSGSSSQGHDSQEFAIENINGIRIVENRLVVYKGTQRNGNLRFRMQGSEPGLADMRQIPTYWRAWIDYSGDKPGKLIEAVVEYVNSEKQRLNIPLWKKRTR